MNPAMYPPGLYPMHPDQQAELEAERQKEATAIRERNLAKKNRAAGLPEPREGTILYVSTARGIPRRSRAGVTFEYRQRTKVKVIGVDDAELLDLRAKGSPMPIVNVHGAEEILNDDALSVHSNPAQAEDAAKSQARVLELEDALAARERELTKLRADARRGAADPGDGRPSRLPAAEHAAAEFGGNAPTSSTGPSHGTTATGGHAKGHGGSTDPDNDHTQPGKGQAKKS